MLAARSNPFGNLARLISEQFDFGAGGLSGLKSNLAITRATIGTTIDHEGMVKNCLSGEARFGGMRRVRNLFTASSTLSTQNVTTIAGTYTVSFSGTGTITFSGTYTGSLAGTGASIRRSITFTTTAGTLTCTVSGSVTSAQCENVTGQSNQNPSEYVSVGVLSTPFHGYGVDGVKYFATTNGNAVAANVVTEAAGVTVEGLVTGSYTNTIKGLLAEEARTNVVPYSSNFGSGWSVITTPTRSAAAKYCGDIALDLIGDDSAAELDGYQQVVTFTADAIKSISFLIAQGTSASTAVRLRDATAPADRALGVVTWSAGVPTYTPTTGTLERAAEAMGNGVYRIFLASTSVTAANTNVLIFYPATDAALNVTATGDIYIGGVQAENATVASSHIPTTTASVPRNADAVSVATGSWYNATSGTVVATVVPGNVAAQRGIMAFDDGTANERMDLNINASAAAFFNVVDGGAQQTALLTQGALTNGQKSIVVASYKVNDFTVTLDGETVQTDTAGTLPTITTLRVGSNQAAEYLNGYIRSLNIYPIELPDAIQAFLTRSTTAFYGLREDGTYELREDGSKEVLETV